MNYPLSPAFGRDTLYYTVDVPYECQSVNIKTTTESSNSTVKYDGLSSDGQGNYNNYPLAVGPNTVKIRVLTTVIDMYKDYTLVINRAQSSNAGLGSISASPGSLSPAFNTGTTEYTVNVANGTDKIAVSAIPSDPAAGLMMGGTAQGSGVAREIPLQVGANVIEITVTAPDAITTGTYKITVNRAEPPDTDPPALGLPADITAEATDGSGANVNFQVMAMDAVDGEVPVTCSKNSGSLFQIGDTTVECSAADKAGNEASGSFKVTVRDTTPPVIPDIADISVEEAVYNEGIAVNYPSITASDAVDGNIPVVFTRPPGSVFKAGVTPVTCLAEDGFGNAAFKTFKVTVVDTSAPLAVDSTSPADGAAGVPVDVPIYIDFNRSVSESVYFDGISLSSGGSVVDCVYSSISGGRLTLTPDNPLSYDTAYTVTLPANAVEDDNGNHLAADYVFSFTTASGPEGGGSPPVVYYTIPADNAVEVPADSVIKVGFSESVRRSDNFDSIRIYCGENETVAGYVYGISGSTLTLTPDAPLPYGSECAVFIPDGSVEDTDGKRLAAR